MFKKILSIVTLALIIVIVWGALAQEVTIDEQTMFVWQALLQQLQTLNPLVLILLIPAQILMYYAAGQMYFSFLRAKRNRLPSRWHLLRVSLEINFVNTAIPSGGASGFGYLAWRLRTLGVSAGQATFMHMLRFSISSVGNTIQTWISIIIVLISGSVIPGQEWVLWAAALVAIGVEVAVVTAFIVVMSKRRIGWFAKVTSSFINGFIKIITFGKKRSILARTKVDKYFTDLHEDWLVFRHNKEAIIRPCIWGMLYAFLEIATYWVVAIALGQPGILPQIAIAEGIGSVIGTLLPTPGGIGGYEGAMIGVLWATGVDLRTATIVVVVTRVVILAGTVISGWGFYEHALLSKKGPKHARKPSNS